MTVRCGFLAVQTRCTGFSTHFPIRRFCLATLHPDCRAYSDGEHVEFAYFRAIRHSRKQQPKPKENVR